MIEFERRFLICTDTKEKEEEFLRYTSGGKNYFISQYFLSLDPVVRIRSKSRVLQVAGGKPLQYEDQKFFLTVKGKRIEGKCEELEKEISSDFYFYYMQAAIGETITKIRNVTEFEDNFTTLKLEIDIFSGKNSKLRLAEVELPVGFPLNLSLLPNFIGKEITDEHRYSNASLAVKPFSTW